MKDKKKSLKNIVVFALSAIMAVSVFTGCGVSKQKTPIKPNTSQSQSQSQNKNKPSKKQPGINKDKKNPASSGATNQKEIESQKETMKEKNNKDTEVKKANPDSKKKTDTSAQTSKPQNSAEKKPASKAPMAQKSKSTK